MNNIVAKYTYDEGNGSVLKDFSGNNRDGIIVGASWQKGLHGSSLKFSNDGNYVDVGNFDIIGNKLTIISWFNPDTFSNLPVFNDARFVSKATSSNESLHWWMLGSISLDGGVTATLRFRLKTNGVTTTQIANGGNIKLKQWQHAAAVYTGSRMLLYLNGVLVGSINKSGNITNNSLVNTFIGRNTSGFLGAFRGLLDETYIFNTVLNVNEINKIANRGIDRNKIKVFLLKNKFK